MRTTTTIEETTLELHGEVQVNPDWLAIRRRIRRLAAGATLSEISGALHRAHLPTRCNTARRESTLISEVRDLLDNPQTKRSRTFTDGYRQLEKLAMLKAGWDGEAGDAVPAEVIRAVRIHLDVFRQVASALPQELLWDTPWLAAATDGSIGIDWRCSERRLAVTYDAAGGVEFSATGPDVDRAGDIVTGSNTDTRSLATWLFTGRWPA